MRTGKGIFLGISSLVIVAVGYHFTTAPAVVAPILIHRTPTPTTVAPQSPAPAAAAMPAVHALVASDAADWEHEFSTTKDLRATMERAGRAALAGDGRAAWLLSQNSMRCDMYLSLGRANARPTPEQYLNAMLYRI